MKHQYSFERLNVFQESRSFTKEIYMLVRVFPADEKFGLTSQIKRATISIVSNLAEGSSRNSPKEQIRFLEIAYGSALEVYSQLLLACDLEFISEDELDLFSIKIKSITNKLNALKNAIEKRV